MPEETVLATEETPLPSAEEAVQAAAVESAESAPAAEESTEQPEGEQPRDEQGKFIPAGVQKRYDRIIGTANRELQEARRIRQELEAELAKTRGSAPETKPVATRDDIPKLADFDSVEEHAVAVYEYMTAKREAKAREVDVQRTIAEQAAQYQRKVTESKKQLPADFDEVISSLDGVNIPQAMAELVMTDPQGPMLHYHFGANPDELARIAALPPHRAGYEIGLIKARLTAPKAAAPPPRPSSAPPPATPVKGGSVAALKAPTSQREYEQWRREGGGK